MIFSYFAVRTVRATSIMKFTNLTLVLLLCISAFSIRAAEITSDEKDPQEVNQVDADGKKTGLWIVYGKDKPQKNYPAEGKVEEGTYAADRKTGEWIFYHADGVTPKLKGVFVNGRPRGLYTKYWENGNTKEEGNFVDGKQTEVYKTYYEDGVMMQSKNFNGDGREDGLQQFFHPNGQLEFEYNKVDGINKGTATRYYENGDVKQIITYNEDGSVAGTEEMAMVNAPVKEDVSEEEGEVTVSGGPSGASGKTKDGKKFDKDGYNKVYNDDDELWMDGKFKGGNLWDGKLYKYDSDGILEKIEIWKKGKYHSDGQL